MYECIYKFSKYLIVLSSNFWQNKYLNPAHWYPLSFPASATKKLIIND